jgi:hypothetical protein
VSGGYHPDCDPVLTAGRLTCCHCQEVSYASDADWITDTLILAAFGQDHKPWCSQRRQPNLVLVDITSDDRSVPLVDSPQRCRDTVRHGPRRGQQCTLKAAPRSVYCAAHARTRQEST